MRDIKTYRGYAEDCRRMAERMSEKDRAALLHMAEVWEKQADEAERHEKTSDKKSVTPR